MTRVLVLKTAALGDVLRTTSILPGLAERDPDLELTWVTAPAARPLLEHHPLVDRLETIDVSDPGAMRALQARLAATRWQRVLSLDDEEPLCRLASALDAERLSGAYLDAAGRRRYTADLAPWFDMGLLSVHGKERADALKIANRRSHPEIFARALGVRAGRPELVLDDAPRAFGEAFAGRHELAAGRPVVGLNTGAGGRWPSKELSVERTAALARQLAVALGGRATFLVLGGELETERNTRLVAELAAREPAPRVVDAGTGNSLLEFAALVSLCDLLVVSDSLALHVALALGVPVVAFFAPTSAAEVHLFGLGEKVVSTAPDACSYRPDADNSTITPERLAAACLRVLGRRESR